MYRYNVQELTGVGYEELRDAQTREILAWFIDGWLWGLPAKVSKSSVDNAAYQCETLVIAA